MDIYDEIAKDMVVRKISTAAAFAVGTLSAPVIGTTFDFVIHKIYMKTNKLYRQTFMAMRRIGFSFKSAADVAANTVRLRREDSIMQDALVRGSARRRRR